jgi:UDPglucose 6-dehydrogenase
MRVAIMGAGYVGLTTGVALAYLGHKVICIDKNEELISLLNSGTPPIYEQGLRSILLEVRANLTFKTTINEDITESEVIILAVGTPPKADGDADLSQVEEVVNTLAGLLKPGTHPVIVNKSTVPVGTARLIKTMLGSGGSFSVVANPEFLREGTALRDFLYPDRIVLGAEDNLGVERLRELYASIISQDFTAPGYLTRPAGYFHPEMLVTDYNSAELIKYSANAFLAIKISFINELSGLAERLGVSISEVARGIGLDRRIGASYLNAGIGWGGSCLGKDIGALRHMAARYNYAMPLVEAGVIINNKQRVLAMAKLQEVLKDLAGKTIGVLGLAFKPMTDDLRDAPAIEIISMLLEQGARVKAYDPLAVNKFKKIYHYLPVECATDVMMLAKNCDAIIIATDWPEFKECSWERLGNLMRQKIVIDGRNILKPREMRKIDFVYLSMGQ